MDDEQKEILDQIESGGIKKKPKRMFVLKKIAIIAGAFIFLALALFIISYTFDLIISPNLSMLPLFGGRGLIFYIIMFPWIPLFIGLFIVIVLTITLQQYAFVYRKPLVYLLICIVAIFCLTTFITHITSFHKRFSNFAAQNNFFVFEQFYSNINSSKNTELTFGAVSDMSPGKWDIKSKSGQIFAVNISNSAKLPPANSVKIGDEVAVFGSRNGNSIKAFEIQKESISSIQLNYNYTSTVAIF